MIQQVKTLCRRLCGGTCGIIVTLEDGIIKSVKGDPDSEFKKGFICPKGRSIPELIYHLDRITHTLRRTGDKGNRCWTRISKDEALETVAHKLIDYSKQFGPESILFCVGAYRGWERSFIQRLASVLGTPNTVSIDNICHAPRTQAAIHTYGSVTTPDYAHPPKCILVWGRNSFQNGGVGTPALFRSAYYAGCKIIVIDPRRIPIVSKAHTWIKPRPGSDGLLALGFLSVIITEELFDRDFVNSWTVGFDELKEFVAQYPVDKVAKETWIPKGEIEKIARLYATEKPAVIQWGNALDQTRNAFQTCRAICILRAITGNIDVSGGEYMPAAVPQVPIKEFIMVKGSKRENKQQIGSRYKVAAKSYLVPSQEAMSAILDEKPNPIKAAVIFGSNPMLTYTNARKTFEALNKIVFLVVIDMFMTPTAEMADIILPVAANLEFDDLLSRPGIVAAQPKVVEPPGDCESDIQIVNLLARKMGFGESFWNDEASAFDMILKPLRMTYADLKEKDFLKADKNYRKYENRGFGTPTGKVELFSEQLKEMGIDPLLTYVEPSQTPLSSPDSAKEYPLVLTNYKNPFYYHASHRNIPSLRKLSPEPIVEMNPATGNELGLNENDYVYIETPKGRIRQKLRWNEGLDQRVITVAHGWWFPEGKTDDLYNWEVANLNILTDDSYPCDPAMGATTLRGIMCKVYKS